MVQQKQQQSDVASSNNQRKKYNLKNDIIFKAFFSRKGNEEFLIDFLNALLKIDIKEIKIRDEVSLEQLSILEKGGRLDLQAILNNDTIVNIELQIANYFNIKERTTYYCSKVLSQETLRGTDYKDIQQIIMVNILDYELFDFDEYISESKIVLDKHREYEALNGIKWYFIELPKFRRSHPNMDEKINQWLAFIDDYDRGLVKMAEEKNKTIEKAKVEFGYLTGNDAVRRLEELKEKWEMDWNSNMNYVKREAKKEGIKEGLKEGQKTGEKQKSKEIAKAMLEEKMPIELIEKVTKLSKEEIEKL